MEFPFNHRCLYWGRLAIMKIKKIKKNKEWVEKCPRCGGQEWSVPEYICDKCHWQDPTIKTCN